MKKCHLPGLIASSFVLCLFLFSSDATAANSDVYMDSPISPDIIKGNDVTFEWHYTKSANQTKIVLFTSAGNRDITLHYVNTLSGPEYIWEDFPYGYGWWYLKVYIDNNHDFNWARTTPKQFHHQFPADWEPTDPIKDINYSVKYKSYGRIEFLELQRDYLIYLPDYFTNKQKLPYGDRYRRAKMASLVLYLTDKNWDFINIYAGGLLEIKQGYRWDSASFPCKKLPNNPCIDDDANIRSSLVHDSLYDLMRMYYLNPDENGYRPAGRFNRQMADMMHYMIAIEDGQHNKDFFTYWPLRGNGALGDYYDLQSWGASASHDDGRLPGWKYHVSELTATASDKKVVLEWKRANDAGEEPAGHEALKQEEKDLGYDIVRDGEPIDWVNYKSTSYTDANVVSGNTYDYQIRKVENIMGLNWDDYSNTIQVTVPLGNAAPVADAGADQTVSVESDCSVAVTLDGSGSYDEDGDNLTYSWLMDGVQIATVVEPTIQLSLDVHVITLVVNDGQENSLPDQVIITVEDTTAPMITCPENIAVSGGLGGTEVLYNPTAIDNCDANVTVTTDIASGSLFPKGVTAVTAIATDASGNSSTCTFDVIVSCFGINEVKIKTKKDKHTHKHEKGDDIIIKGTFSSAVPIDLAVDDVLYVVDDGQGYVVEFFIPAGSFKQEGKKGDKNKFKFHSSKKREPDFEVKFDFDKCKFEFKAKKVAGIEEITGTSIDVILYAGANIGQETVTPELKGKGKHLEYKAKPRLDCCPKCKV